MYRRDYRPQQRRQRTFVGSLDQEVAQSAQEGRFLAQPVLDVRHAVREDTLELPCLATLLRRKTADLVLQQGGGIVQIDAPEDFGDLIGKVLEPALVAVGTAGLLEVAVDDRMTLDRSGPLAQALQHRFEEWFQPALFASTLQQPRREDL